MPSLWKKHKGNRISRLVADFQTPPKRGGSLVVETGFPTSIVDLFVKNRDRLKKPSKKKHRSKQPTTTTTTTESEEDPFHVLPSPVSDCDPLVSLSKLDVPSCSIDEKNQETDDQKINSDLYVEEIVAQKNPCVELNSDCCKDEVGSNWGLLISKKAIWFSILKGALVVVVALYTKKVVVGITMGAFLLLLFEYVGNLFFGFLKPCEDAKRNLQGFSRVSRGAIGISSQVEKQGERGVLFKSSRKKEVGNNVDSEREIGNGIASMGVIEQDGISNTSKGEINQGNGVPSLVKESPCLDEEVRNKTVSEIEVIEPDVCVWKNNSSGDHRGECCEPRSIKGEKEGEGSKMVNHNGKVKKGKKFWKKLVPKHIHRKRKHKQKKEQEHQNHEVPIEEITDELDEKDDREEDDQEMIDGEESSLSSSFDEVECGGKEPPFGSVNRSHSGMLQNGAIKKRVMNVKGFAIVGIVLAGLIQGRILALVLTVICCLVFKMMRR